MGGMDIVLKDKDGKIKQDYHISKKQGEGKVVEVDKLKEKK